MKEQGDHTTLDSEYWTKRYTSDETQWDIGHVSTPIKEYADSITDKSLRILIPGCGNAYEAEYFHTLGFQNVFLVDIALPPLEVFAVRCPDFPKAQLLHTDFFELHEEFDLIIEQTFFCALNPELRPNYAKKMAELLPKGGKLVGLLFNDSLNSDRPPFGGNKEEYQEYFNPYFEFEHFETANNSIKPRSGRELFISLIKK